MSVQIVELALKNLDERLRGTKPVDPAVSKCIMALWTNLTKEEREQIMYKSVKDDQ